MPAIKDETQTIATNEINLSLEPVKVTNQYFSGKRKRNTYYDELTKTGEEYVILLISYELNFEVKKIDYYFRLAKKLQHSFHIPGWKLHLPNPKNFDKKFVRNKIITLAISFKSELDKEQASISVTQAFVLNNAYKNFLWE